MKYYIIALLLQKRGVASETWLYKITEFIACVQYQTHHQHLA